MQIYATPLLAVFKSTYCKRSTYPGGKEVKETMKKTRVAVYRRVSRDQKSYASLIGADERKINSESSMLYAGSYIDQDGCRSAFKRLMAAAGEGDIDRIETESISAFANNIGELLTTVCKLRCLRHPVVFHFAEEDVTTGTDDWEHCVCFLIPVVQRLAYEWDFYELVCWIEDHRKEYVHFIMTGEG